MKKVIGLILGVAIIFAAGHALAWQTVEGGSAQWTSYNVGGPNNNAGGMNYSEGTYSAEGCFLAFGGATADGVTKANVAGGSNWRAAGACTHSESNALSSGIFGPASTGVYGEGIVGHNTYLDAGTGGSTYGMASYEYGTTNSGFLASYSQGSGTAMTGGIVTRNYVPNGVAAHARSGSFSVAGAH